MSIFEGEEVGKGPKKEHLDEVSRDIPIVLSILGFKWCMDPEIYKELINDDRLKIRVSAGFSISPDISPIHQIDIIRGIRERIDSNYFKTTTIKFLADGVIEGTTASLIEPYEIETGKGENYYGDFLWDKDELSKAIEYANKNGFSIHVHSIGDNATKLILDAIEKDDLDDQTDYRNSITYIQLVRKEDIKRFKKLNIIASVQPYWHLKGPNWWDVVDYKLVGERAKHEYPLNSFVEAGVRIASSSDHSATPVPNPFFAIQAGVTRNLYNASYFCVKTICNIDEEKWLLNQEERVSVEEMVRSFTINGAYLIFRDDEIGSIEVGKYADFIVLDRDIFGIEPLDIEKTQVLMTFFDGEVVYQRDNL